MNLLESGCFFLGQIVFIPPFLAATAGLSGKKLSFPQYLGYTLISPFFVYIYSIVLYGLLAEFLKAYGIAETFTGFVAFGDVLALLLSIVMAFLYAYGDKGNKRILDIYVYACFYMSSMVFTITYSIPSHALLLGVAVPCFFSWLMYRLLVCPLKDITRSIEYFHGSMLFFPIGSELMLILRFILNAVSVSDPMLEKYDIALNTYLTIFGYIVHFFIFASLALLKRDIQSIREIDEKRKQVTETNEHIQRLSLDTLMALAATIDAKDAYTNGHSSRVAEVSAQLAQKLGYDDDAILKVRKAALLHDIGKIGVPDEIIKKKNSLTSVEYSQMKNHPGMGYEILANLEEMPELRLGAMYHHERWDGKGYPLGVAGENIPEVARIITVADAFDAMTSERSYRSALPPEKVRSEIEEGKGSQFDPRVAQAMLEILDNGPKPAFLQATS